MLRNTVRSVRLASVKSGSATYFHPRLNAIEQRDENGGPLVIIVSEDDFKL